MTDYVFTYGTLRPSLYPGRAAAWVRAFLVDQLTMIDLGRYPALVEATDEHEIVGDVIEVDSVTRFDSYEGYLPNGQGLYDRRRVKVRGADAKVYLAWVYFMHKDRAPEWGRTVPTGDWADVLRTRAEQRPL